MNTYLYHRIAFSVLLSQLHHSPCSFADEPRISSPAQLSETQPQTWPAVIVRGKLDQVPIGAKYIEPEPSAESRVWDAADMVASAPGASVVRNGTVTGIMQLRGLTGDRVRVLVDDMTITPACPNHMDPPLHYATPATVGSIHLLAGLTPVSLGGDSLAGTIRVEPEPLRLSPHAKPWVSGGVGFASRSVNEGWGTHARTSIANDWLALRYDGLQETGEDYRFPGGHVRDSGFDTQQHTARIGAALGRSFLEASIGAGTTRDAGTPALPMDMVEDDSLRASLRYQVDSGWGQWQASAYYHTIDHLMDNYTLRPVTTMRMLSPASSDDAGGKVALELPGEIHKVVLGSEAHFNRSDAFQANADSGMQQDTLKDTRRDRWAGFVDWLTDWSDQWQTRAGVRLDAIWMDAASVERFFPTSAADRVAFNAIDRSLSDLNFDAMIAARYHFSDRTALEWGLARKSRAPSTLERYLWTPLSASAGQADGRTYWGNLSLDSETAHLAAVTIEVRDQAWELELSPFYNYITDYIQGTPTTRLDTAGLPVLRFQNQDGVELYGGELTGQIRLYPTLRLRGAISYVRGRDIETGDSLYRIAPCHGNLAMDLRWGVSTTTAEFAWAMRQADVAAYNRESETPGYGIIHLRTSLQLHRHLRIDAGVDNLLDKHYSDHLGGINRVRLSDVPLNARLPQPGRAFYVGAEFKF